MKFLLYIVSLLFLVTLHAQKKTPEYYNYPFEDTYQPLTIRANVILLQRSDGSGNFDLKNAEEKKLLEDYLEFVNFVYSNFKEPEDLTGCYTGTDFYPNAKIKIKYNLIEVRNEYAWNYLNSGGDPDNKNFKGFTPSENWYIKSLDDSISNANNIPNGINIYLTTNGKRFDELKKNKSKGYDLSGAAAAQLPGNKNLTRSSQIHLPNRYLKYLLHKYQAPIEYKTTWEETRKWHLSDAKGFAHEFGHTLGLSHSNEYHGANKCKYSLMAQGGTDPKTYLQPTEIKKIHWNLTQTNLMQFVTEESHYGVTWTINENTNWDKVRRFYNDFEIGKDVTLIISDSIILPPQSKIKLNKNSKIVFKGKGKLVNAFGQEYKNFDKHKTSKIIKE